VLPEAANQAVFTGNAYSGPELNDPVEFVSALAGGRTANVLLAALKVGLIGIYEVHLFHYRWLNGTVEINHEHTDHRWIAAADYRGLAVMRGVDEDIRLLDIWPLERLHLELVPIALGGLAVPPPRL
jgi:hypothetical protein